MSANDRQVGGDHYRAKIQHWDMAILHSGVAYHINCATGYLSRYKKKGKPLEDLEKALHYTQKVVEADFQVVSGYLTDRQIDQFCQANDLGPEEYRILRILWKSVDVSPAIPLIEQLIAKQQGEDARFSGL